MTSFNPWQDLLLLQTREKLEKQHLEDTVRTEQQDHLLRKAREEASTSATRHQEELDKLYTKLNTLQNEQPSLGDDHIVETMRSLSQNLDSWVKANFKDATKLQSWHGSDGNRFPHSSSQRRAYIQSFICCMIHTWIFSPYQFGICDDPYGHFLCQLEVCVGRHCSETVLNTWKTATSMAIEGDSKDNDEGIFTDIIKAVEDRFGTFGSTSDESRKRQLGKLLRKCADFKIALSRQKQAFLFFRSPVGAEFSPQFMTFGGGDGQPAGKVRWSLWPAITRCHDDTGREVLEAELVWTME
ncbi:hypothetical protein BO78DRAFT_439574 [Aspergillus sclerotiicarbonarius CBS 121057]|uniref:Uncharacterized protein n=1 Tax=Aspergillus sclerotiicarbonarius (strain CBS 121057 / IBT 28362) TaxID=1448318 RepID=A0A319DRF1_ASPSB|nr:hypothetical protein BO78DRAFT_439574 [Aspergillus sclerotiicarbonarius CBS 121057]